jgi:hypothetical protein
LISRRSQLAICAALVAGTVFSAFAIEYDERRLDARLDGDYLHVIAPNFSFLSGKSLERLKDGASVAFIAQLTVSTSPNYVVPDAPPSVARFAVSYDIWDERFSVTKIGDHDQKLSKSHLTGPAAEAWCFDKLTLHRADLPTDRPFYIQLDMRVEDPRDTAGMIGDGGISLARMIQVFGRPVRDKQAHWLLNSGQVRLEELIRKGTHG